MGEKLKGTVSMKKMKGTKLYRRKQAQFLVAQKGCKIPTWRHIPTLYL